MNKVETVKLNNGIEMPLEGFGVFQVPDPAVCEQAVLDAIATGYRLIDTAAAYMNEEAVGRAIAKCGVPREELFVTTKLWVQDASYEGAKQAIETSMKKLGLDYIDLYLIHQPMGDYIGAYRAMEEAVETGKARAIGVSNFYPDRFVDIAEFNKIKPAVNQVEMHVFNQQIEPQKIMKTYGTQIMSWGPFAEGKNNFFTNETLAAIGKQYGKSIAQVALRFLVQRGAVVIPKSVHKERMKQNMDIFDFVLTEQDMAAIARLDQNKSLFFSHQDPEIVKFLINYGK